MILGAGTAGTMIANKLHKRLPDWSITLVDKDDIHDYQPVYLFIPFAINHPREIRKTKRPYIDDGIDIVMSEIELVDPEAQEVHLANGDKLAYDYLVVATGTSR